MRPRPASASAGASTSIGRQREVSWTSTRNSPQEQVIASMTIPVTSCLMALVTSSLVSRTATSWSTGISQAQMAARTWRRASAEAAGPAVSRIRHCRSSVGRVGAITFIGFLWGRVELASGSGFGAPPVAIKMVLQLAVRDIGQLTDFDRMLRSPWSGGSGRGWHAVVTAAETTARSVERGLKTPVRSGAGPAPGARPVRLGGVEDEGPGLGGAERGVRQGLERDPVQVRLPLPLQGDAAPELLGDHHVPLRRLAVIIGGGIGVVPEAEDDEGLAEHRVLAAEREDLQGQVRPVAVADEPLQLLVHQRLVTDPALEHRLVEHDRQPQVITIQDLLAAHPDADRPPDHARRHRLDPAVAADDVPGIGLGLQQAGDHVHVPDGHGCGLVLEPDELLVVLGQALGELLPPALAGGVLGQPEQQIAARTGDLVVVEQPSDLLRAQAGPGPLVPADLGRRPPQRGGDRVPALAAVLPDSAKFGGQAAAPHRGTCWRGHRVILLLGAARAGGCDGLRIFQQNVQLILFVPASSPIVTKTRQNGYSRTVLRRRVGDPRSMPWQYAALVYELRLVR